MGLVAEQVELLFELEWVGQRAVGAVVEINDAAVVALGIDLEAGVTRLRQARVPPFT